MRTQQFVLAENLEARRLLALNPGSLDPSFSGDGIVVEANPQMFVKATVIQKDTGKVVVGGDRSGTTELTTRGMLVRYRNDGTLDTGFGTGGKTLLDIHVRKISLQSDGKIVIVGSRINPDFYKADLAVVRLTKDGKIDTTFGGGDGVTIIDTGKNEEGRRLTILPDGRILAGGEDGDVVLAMLKKDGSLDKSFSGDGIRSLQLGGTDTLNQFAPTGDGRFIVAASTSSGSTKKSALVMLKSNGDYDKSFAGSGKFFDTNYIASGIFVQSGGKILVGGVLPNQNPDLPGPPEFRRYKFNGTIDTNFGKAHTGTLGVADEIDHFYVLTAILPQAGGGYILAGTVSPTLSALNQYPVIARLDSSLKLDKTFGTNGYTTVSLNGTEIMQDAAQVIGSKVVMVGTGHNTGSGPVLFSNEVLRFVV